MGTSTDSSGSAAAIPVRKVSAGALAGAAVAIACWLLASYANVAIPAPVQTAIVVVVTFAISWIVPPRDEETVRPRAVPSPAAP